MPHGFDSDGPAEALDGVLDDGEPEPGALGAGRHIGLGQPLALVRRQAAAIVLDDDGDSAQSIVDFLSAKGLDAKPFDCASSLLAAMDAEPFDGFVVDWLLGENTAKDLLSQIRVRMPSGPLVILTGQIATGLATEDELVMVGTAYRALLFEKPTRPLSIFNALQVGFAAPATVT